MKKHFTFLSLSLLLFLYANPLLSQDKEWTLLLYVTGSDIVGDAITDIDEMKAAGNTDNINIVGLLGGAQLTGWETPASSVFVNGEEISTSFFPTADNMADSTNITEFLDWAIPNYPAEKYMLLFYNHGMGFRGFGWDNTVNKSLSVPDIQHGIANSQFVQDTNKFEVIGFDACLMASLEVQSTLRDFGEYYIASEETEPWHAWNWTPVITAMNSGMDLDGAELGEIIVDNYIQHSIDKGTKNVTLSVSDLTKITPLELALNDLFIEINEDEEIDHFIQARAMTEEYHKVVEKPEDSDDVVDIGDLLKNYKTFQPSLSAKIDTALVRLDEAIVYERSDDTRPKATGMTMFVPMNDLADLDELYFVLELDYEPIDFSDTITNFISNIYTPYLAADEDPISGSLDDSFGILPGSGGSVLGENFTAIKIEDDHADLHHIQAVLLEEIVGNPDEYLLLGSTYPDTFVVNGDGSVIYGQRWDEEWLGINGVPAYISDIQFFEVEDETGTVVDAFTRVMIPAILNEGTSDEKDITMSFTFDEDFNHELEEILRDPLQAHIPIPSKERIDLQPGDVIQLKYEVFNITTTESFFQVDENAIINIENGNEDLNLEHDMLLPGNYHLGFVLMDHAHNDTLIIDPMVRVVDPNSTNQFANSDLQFLVSPNPVVDKFNVRFSEFVEAKIEVFDQLGRLVHSQKNDSSQIATVNIGTLTSGTYFLQIIVNEKVVVEKIVKR